jgi:hypothetical protein
MTNYDKFKGKFQKACQSSSHNITFWSYKYPNIEWCQHCSCETCKETCAEKNLPPCSCKHHLAKREGNILKED